MSAYTDINKINMPCLVLKANPTISFTTKEYLCQTRKKIEFNDDINNITSYTKINKYTLLSVKSKSNSVYYSGIYVAAGKLAVR